MSGNGEQIAREIESMHRLDRWHLVAAAILAAAAIALIIVGRLQDDGSLYFALALALIFAGALPLSWAIGGQLWGEEERALAEKVRAQDRERNEFDDRS